LLQEPSNLLSLFPLHLIELLPLLYRERSCITNEIAFIHKAKKFVLHPLLPSQVVEDQLQMKNKREKERNEDKKHVLKMSKS